MKTVTSASLRPFALTLIAAVVLAGCSSSNDDGAPPTGDATSQQADGTPSSTVVGGVSPATGEPAPVGGDGTAPDAAPVDGGPSADPSGNASNDGAASELDRSFGALLTSLGGYQLETLTEEAMLLAESVVAGGGGTELAPGTVALDTNVERVERDTVRTEYACPLGGTVVADIGQIVISESSYSNTADQDRYDFDQCRLETDGVQVLDGSVRTWVNSVSASRGGFANRDVEWTGFDWQQGEAASVAGTALVEVRELLSFDNDGSRNVRIDDYERRRGDRAIERVAGGDFSLRIATSGAGALQVYGLRAAGTVSDASDVGVRVTTDEVFSAELPVPAFDGEGRPLTGTMSLEADDGARLTLTASPDVTRAGPKRVDIVHVDAAGTTTETRGVLPDLAL